MVVHQIVEGSQKAVVDEHRWALLRKPVDLGHSERHVGPNVPLEPPPSFGPHETLNIEGKVGSPEGQDDSVLITDP